MTAVAVAVLAAAAVSLIAPAPAARRARRIAEPARHPAWLHRPARSAPDESGESRPDDTTAGRYYPEEAALMRFLSKSA